MTRRAYEQYLQSDRWIEIRALALARFGGRCALNQLHRSGVEVHHRTYERIGRERLDDLIPLCRRCHARFHAVIPAPPPPDDGRQQVLPFDDPMVDLMDVAA